MPSLLLSLNLSVVLLVVHTGRCLAAVDNEILTQGADVMIRHNKDGRKTRDPVVSLFDSGPGVENEMTITKRLEMSVEEFYVEHEISQKEAREAAEKLDLSQLSASDEAAGCATCTEGELAYCGGAALLGDHCCCERRHREPYAHVPHTCYAGRGRCRTVAADCAQYARLRECCCDRLVGEKYKALFSSASARDSSTSSCLLLTASLLAAVSTL